MFRECWFIECLCEHSVNIRCCIHANVQRTFARTFGEHNANGHTIFGECYLASWVRTSAQRATYRPETSRRCNGHGWARTADRPRVMKTATYTLCDDLTWPACRWTCAIYSLQKYECRRYERRYWKSGSVVDRRQWVDATRRRFRLYRRKKGTYWTDRVSEAKRSPANLWRSLSVMLGKDHDVTGATDHTADGFAEYFTRKVDNIRADTANTPAPVIADTATCSWSSFRRTTEEVRRI